MADPLEALRQPEVRVEPDPLFAAHLRARIARALTLPKGVTVSDITLDIEPAIEPPSATVPLPEPVAPPPIVPYLIVTDARRALDWYADAMGARRVGDPLVMPDGRIGHSELQIGGGVMYLADESPESNVAAPAPGEAVRISLTLTVPDVDRLVERAVRAGAALERAVADYSYGRNAVVRDPFGHRWIVSARAPEPQNDDTDVGAGPRSGDVGYVSLWVPDADRAAAFFGDVLGWRFRHGGGVGARQVDGQSLAHGVFGGQERSTLFLCFYSADLDAALDRVRAAGGTADEPVDEPYGRTAGCVDDQGVRFALVELPPDAAGSRLAINGERNGDVSYITIEVEDSGAARAFYGSVLGWQFTPGRVDDGWGIVDNVPMIGMHGGHEHATTLPMYRVDDIVATVDRVRARGGTSTDPERQSYGLSAECVDDQGTRFYLGQH
jgi:predicted enzyme related to lactoylglutathione lyase